MLAHEYFHSVKSGLAASIRTGHDLCNRTETPLIRFDNGSQRDNAVRHPGLTQQPDFPFREGRIQPTSAISTFPRAQLTDNYFVIPAALCRRNYFRRPPETPIAVDNPRLTPN